MIVTSQYLPLAFTATTSAAMMGQCNVALVYFFNPINAGDLATLQDSNGATIWAGRAEAGNQSQVFRFPRPVSVAGLQVPVLTSGTMYVYFS